MPAFKYLYQTNLGFAARVNSRPQVDDIWSLQSLLPVPKETASMLLMRRHAGNFLIVAVDHQGHSVELRQVGHKRKGEAVNPLEAALEG